MSSPCSSAPGSYRAAGRPAHGSEPRPGERRGPAPAAAPDSTPTPKEFHQSLNTQRRISELISTFGQSFPAPLLCPMACLKDKDLYQ